MGHQTYRQVKVVNTIQTHWVEIPVKGSVTNSRLGTIVVLLNVCCLSVEMPSAQML